MEVKPHEELWTKGVLVNYSYRFTNNIKLKQLFEAQELFSDEEAS